MRLRRTDKPTHDRYARAASVLEAHFSQIRQRIHTDLSQVEPETLAYALGADSRRAARELIAEMRSWADGFEGELMRGADLGASLG